MTSSLNIPRIEFALTFLSDCNPDHRLLALQNLCENNGVWTIPQDRSRYSPVLYEVSLFGVAAISDDIQHLPDNWQRAARNILRSLPTEDGDKEAEQTIA
ncbi:hypothetical protein [Tateyamaria sp. syn59]|uniref:hypothetical protein n=1 Tax=Tateyamaria sp. syn59 TaxID=2576942 RepID=UPI0011BE1BEB|nr:hypothetical protein [Tateyamaria sp. syn59]